MKKLSNLAKSTVLFLSIMLSANTAKAIDDGKIGDLAQLMSPAYAFGMSAMEEDHTGSIQLGALILSTQLAVEGIKALELEERPNGNGWKSFPSGHAAGAFSGAMFVHKRYGWKPAIVPYALSLVTSWSRVKVKAHYVHDTIAGAAIVALFTWGIVDKYLPDGTNIEANANADGVRIGFRTRF